MNFFRLPSFGEFISDFSQNDLPIILQCICDDIEGKSVYGIIQSLERVDFYSPVAFKLFNLPKDLSHFYFDRERQLRYRTFKEEEAVCLFCGTYLHVQKPVSLHGFKIGECTNHMKNGCKVVSTYGMFLMIRSNSIYVSYGNRGSFFPTPYMNVHGEPDEGLKYSPPVFLDKKRYNYLANEVLLGNLIPHHVFRRSDGNIDEGGWETM